ncbi:MAG: acylneuraminate cytidylyltransferase family protein [Pseudarcicella sp.]|nr:acylneuraminate cytidylyltransferase family protein [Pseudarcicella sp.]MBP6410170.1 acylneuraminate cytidylyltransferase family protein [Pseudarcicella sp.]
MKILITLCARGGSKGVPLKNIKPLCGKPLIQYSLETARKFIDENKYDCIIAISTDDNLILDIMNDLGVKTSYIRPEYLSTDAAGKVETIAHLLEYEEEKNNCKFDYILDLDVSSPLRTVEDLNNAFKIIQEDKDAINLFSVSKAHRNPYFNMVEIAEDGYYKLIKPLDKDILSRQKAPKVYDLNASFYFYKKSFFDNGYKSVLTPKALIYEVPHVCFDIDEMIDFEIMDFLIKNNKLGFEI